MGAASFHCLARKKPAGIATDPNDGRPTGALWEFCVKLWQLGWANQVPPTSIIKKAAITFQAQHLRESHSCEFCNPRDLST